MKYFLTVFIIFFLGCGQSDDSGKNNEKESVYSIDMSFTRKTDKTPNPFEVTVTLTKDGKPFSGQTIDVLVKNLNQTTSSITKWENGIYSFTVTPLKTGEFPVTVSYKYDNKEISVSKTPIVLQNVNQNFNQPMSVSGLVNTEGYEDGVTITPDGEYLFVQTGPYKFSSFFVYIESRENGGCGANRLIPERCNHPWVNETFGTYTAPERPGFFAGRFDGTTQLHNAASWGLNADEAPIYALSTMFYGFKKQSDGTFKEPFYLAFNDLNDGIVGPYGLSFKKNNDDSYTVIFTLSDSFTVDYGKDIYTMTTQLGQNVNLGDYELTSRGNPPKRGTNYPSQLVDLNDNSGTQGNPFLYYSNDGNIKSIWIDDEYDNDEDSKKISVYVLNSGTFPDKGNWTKLVLPENVNQLNKEAIQPTFTSEGLYFTEDTNIVFSAYKGEDSLNDYQNNSNWSLPEMILQKDTSITSLYSKEEDIGKIIAIGEPTIAVVNGKKILYFVYGYIRGIDEITGIADIDMQAGFIEEK